MTDMNDLTEDNFYNDFIDELDEALDETAAAFLVHLRSSGVEPADARRLVKQARIYLDAIRANNIAKLDAMILRYTTPLH